MLKSIKLNNYESHEDTTVTFDKGINVITGSSASGKSAILRALEWATSNNQPGTSMLSNWIVTDKETITGETAVELTTDTNSSIRRFRNKNDNGYSPNYNALNGGVPDAIASIINMSDINFEMQHSPHFLLSSSSGEVAKFFNKMINLSAIDDAFTALSEDKRRNSSETARLETEIKRKDDAIKALQYLDKVEGAVIEYEAITRLMEGDKREASILDALLNRLKNIDTDVIQVKLTKMEAVYEIVDKANKDYDELYDKAQKLELILDDLRGNEEALSVAVKYESIREPVTTLYALKGETASLMAQIENLSNKITKINTTTESIENENSILKTLIARLPETCPVCGGAYAINC